MRSAARLLGVVTGIGLVACSEDMDKPTECTPQASTSSPDCQCSLVEDAAPDAECSDFTGTYELKRSICPSDDGSCVPLVGLPERLIVTLIDTGGDTVEASFQTHPFASCTGIRLGCVVTIGQPDDEGRGYCLELSSDTGPNAALTFELRFDGPRVEGFGAVRNIPMECSTEYVYEGERSEDL